MTDIAYAGFWRRANAVTLDMFLVTPLYWVVTHFVAAPVSEALFTALMVIYYAIAFASHWQATPAMRALSVMAVDETGGRLTPTRAAIWCIANGCAMLVVLSGVLYLQMRFPINEANERLMAGDMAGAEAILGMPFAEFYRLAVGALVLCAILSFVWVVSIARGSQKAGLVNGLCGVRFVKGRG